MHVGFMGRSIRPGARGVGRYAGNLARALVQELPSDSLSVFLTADAPCSASIGARRIFAPWPTPNEVTRALWEQTVVPTQVAALGIDLYHSPNYILPAALPCPAVVTVHDLAYLRRHLHRLRSHLYLTVLTSLALRRAQAVVAVSEYTRRALEARYPAVRGRVEVIYEGVDPALSPPSAHDLREFRCRLGLSDPYILFVGTLEPRKNLVRLIRAFELVVQETRLPHRLVLAGGNGWKSAALDRAIATSPLRERILLPGYVSDTELACWYGGADLFAWPSLEEGFGLPPLEAMALGVPVVTSHSSSLPEVVGEAAVLIDPLDVTALAEAMQRVLRQPDLADRLRGAGRARAACFTWSEAARRHAALYRRLAARGQP